MRGHIWTAFLNPIDRPPILSNFFPTTFLSLFLHPKPLLNLSHSPLILILILILMLFLISGDIHPNPSPIELCSVCSRRVTWGTDQYNVPTVFSGYTSSALVFLPLTFVKSPRDTLGLAQCAHPLLNSPTLLHPNPVSSSINTPNPPSSIRNTHKTIFSKMNPTPKQPRTTPPTLLTIPN